MDWKIFISTFTVIFLAELGDKTQVAALTVSSQTKSTWSVLLAVVLALSLAGVIGVLVGRALGEWVNLQHLKIVAGVMFIALGLWTLFTT